MHGLDLRAALVCVALGTAACGSSGSGGTLAPGAGVFDLQGGHSFEVPVVPVPGHGASAALPLRIEWVAPDGTGFEGSGLASGRDALVFTLPDVPAARYRVTVWQGQVEVARGEVEHSGAAVPADPLVVLEATLAMLNGYLERAWPAAMDGTISPDLWPFVRDATLDVAAVSAAISAASVADRSTIAAWLAPNNALLEQIGSGLIEARGTACGARTVSESLAELARLEARAAELAAGYALASALEVASVPLAQRIGFLLDQVMFVRHHELLELTVEAPVVLSPAPLIDCLGQLPSQPVVVGAPVEIGLQGLGRGAEVGDRSGPWPALAAALEGVDEALSRGTDLIVLAAGRLEVAVTQLPRLVEVPAAAALGALAPDSYGIPWLEARDMFGNAVAVSFTAAPSGRLVFTLGGGEVGSAVRIVFEVTQPGVGPSATHELSLSIADPARPLPSMVHVAPGTFVMGATGWSGGPFDPSAPEVGPLHEVTLTRPFWIGAREVSQAEWTAFQGTNPSSWTGADLPVEQVSWDEAREYCAALNAYQSALGNVPQGYSYRLPTEAEWEYACRATTSSEFHFGDRIQCGHANFARYGEGGFCAVSRTTPCGSYAPNLFGLRDMHGNVAEWCLDSLAPYTSAPQTDPFVTGFFWRVQRGGSFRDIEAQCRSGARASDAPSARSERVGFRVVLGPTLEP